MPQGKPLVLYYYNSVYLIQLSIQLSIFLGNLLQHNKGIVPQIMKYWLLLRVSIIGMSTLWEVLFVFIPSINLLSFLVSQNLVDANFNGQPSL